MKQYKNQVSSRRIRDTLHIITIFVVEGPAGSERANAIITHSPQLQSEVETLMIRNHDRYSLNMECVRTLRP